MFRPPPPPPILYSCPHSKGKGLEEKGEDTALSPPFVSRRSPVPGSAPLHEGAKVLTPLCPPQAVPTMQEGVGGPCRGLCRCCPSHLLGLG